MHRLGGDDPRQLGPYRLKAVIGDGGMGRVYLGTSPGGRAVAVKVIGPGLAGRPGYRERFAREARAAMSVSGLYTASVVDADTTGERPYLATEFVPAPSLAEAVAATGPLPPGAVRALAGGMAEALVAIHRAGLVHRDVKPHNILLAADGPVVIDFGIAVGEDPSLTAVGVTVGTPGYIAPEVLRGNEPSARSDVFSLGCVLVFAARGTGPFGKGDPLSIAHRTVEGEADLSGLPQEVRALVTPMLQRDPARRPTPAQLLQHVSLSSGVLLHDGLWLPDPIRTLLVQRRRQVQLALGANGEEAGAGSADPLVPVAAPGPGPMPGRQPPAPHVHGPYPPPPHVPVPARSPSHRSFYAVVGSAAAVVLVGAVITVLLLTRGTGTPGANASGSGTPAANLGTGIDTDTPGTPSASSEPSTGPASGDATPSSGDGVAHYQPGTYPVNQTVATDLLGDTVTLSSITVNGDGSVSVKLTYTDAFAGEWGCSAAKAGEASLTIDGSSETDLSTGSDCTRNPGKTWYMSVGQSISGSEYFAVAPAGSGDWTFGLTSMSVDDLPEFQGEVSGISIPRQS